MVMIMRVMLILYCVSDGVEWNGIKLLFSSKCENALKTLATKVFAFFWVDLSFFWVDPSFFWQF